MKDIIKSIKELLFHPTFHSLVVAVTAIYLMFGVLNAGFILVQVLYSIGSFFAENNHLTIF
jgi:hypothetical protein